MDAQREMKTGFSGGLVILGDVTAQEELVIHGRVEGQITVPDHHVLIAASADVRAKVTAQSVTVEGSVDGTIVAAERVVIERSAIVRAHLTTPVLALADGAQFTGTVDPTRTEAAMHVAKYRQKQAT